MKQPLWVVEIVIVGEQQGEKEGFLALLKEAFHHTLTSFIGFRKCAYFTNKGSSHQQLSASSELCSAFLEIPQPLLTTITTTTTAATTTFQHPAGSEMTLP